MNTDLYHDLARHLDTLPIGFPPTGSGIELALLAQVFAPDEAALALLVRAAPEPAEAIALRAGLEVPSAEARLQGMARRGLIRRVEESGRARYCLLPFLYGIYESLLPRLDAELARLYEQWYCETHGGGVVREFPPVHRVIPVEEAVAVNVEILPHEWATRLVSEARSWAVRDCICRVQRRLAGRGCAHPLDVCLVFAPVEGAFDRSEVDRPVSTEEALAILRRAAEAGLVHTVYNAREGIHHICNCCTCACMFLRGVTESGRLSGVARSAFRTAVDAGRCTGCGACLERCQFGALSLPGPACAVDPARCMGCGLCAAACAPGALRLERLPEEARPALPADRRAWAEQRLQGRGLL